MTDFKIKEIATETYQRPEIDRGYANQALSVNLSTREIAIKPISEETKKIFTGGKGFQNVIVDQS